MGEEHLQLSVRLSLQSPGLVEFKRQIGKTLAILAVVLSSCNNGQVKQTGDPQIDTFVETHHQTLIETDTILIKLEAKRDSLNQ